MARKKKETAAPVVDLAVVGEEVAPLRTTAEQQLAWLNSAPLDTTEAVDMFGEILLDVRARKDTLEARRTEITGPLNAAKRAVDALFRPVRDILDAMDDTIVKRVGAKLQELRGARDVALDAASAGDRSAATLEVAHTDATAPDGFSEVEEYDLEIVDMAAIPRHFLTFDAGLARAYVKHHRGACEIPGVKIVKRIALRRKAGT